MTRNDTPDKIEWSIHPRSGTDSAQWDWGITHRLLHSRYLNIGSYTILSWIEQG